MICDRAYSIGLRCTISLSEACHLSEQCIYSCFLLEIRPKLRIPPSSQHDFRIGTFQKRTWLVYRSIHISRQCTQRQHPPKFLCLILSDFGVLRDVELMSSGDIEIRALFPLDMNAREWTCFSLEVTGRLYVICRVVTAQVSLGQLGSWLLTEFLHTSFFCVRSTFFIRWPSTSRFALNLIW